MGGNALKHTVTRRYAKEEFFELWNELKPKLEKAFNTAAELVISYKSKDDFGDMDALILNSGNLPDSKEIVRILTEDFGANEVFINSTIYSFDYKGLQIDLIFTPTRNWETSQVFFAYNDLGNLMGKIFHKLGLSYGFEGLVYVYRINDCRILDRFVISRDPKKIFEFIGLSWEKFEEGFNSVEEIFDYVISSKYFEPESFYYENLDQKNRVRNKKRKNYHLFIEYINTKFKKEEDVDNSKKYHYDKNKERFWPIIHEAFKQDCDFLGTIYDLQEKEKERVLFSSKYNGKIIMELIPNLVGEQLGKFIDSHKKSKDDFDNFIFNSTEEEIKQDILTHYNLIFSFPLTQIVKSETINIHITNIKPAGDQL